MIKITSPKVLFRDNNIIDNFHRVKTSSEPKNMTLEYKCIDSNDICLPFADQKGLMITYNDYRMIYSSEVSNYPFYPRFLPNETINYRSECCNNMQLLDYSNYRRNSFGYNKCH